MNLCDLDECWVVYLLFDMIFFDVEFFERFVVEDWLIVDVLVVWWRIGCNFVVCNSFLVLLVIMDFEGIFFGDVECSDVEWI